MKGGSELGHLPLCIIIGTPWRMLNLTKSALKNHSRSHLRLH